MPLSARRWLVACFSSANAAARNTRATLGSFSRSAMSANARYFMCAWLSPANAACRLAWVMSFIAEILLLSFRCEMGFATELINLRQRGTNARGATCTHAASLSHQKNRVNDGEHIHRPGATRFVSPDGNPVDQGDQCSRILLRNCFVRSLLGAVKSPSGVVSSTILPLSMKMMRWRRRGRSPSRASRTPSSCRSWPDPASRPALP